jgi:hypothetical protein
VVVNPGTLSADLTLSLILALADDSFPPLALDPVSDVLAAVAAPPFFCLDFPPVVWFCAAVFLAFADRVEMIDTVGDPPDDDEDEDLLGHRFEPDQHLLSETISSPLSHSPIFARPDFQAPIIPFSFPPSIQTTSQDQLIRIFHRLCSCLWGRWRRRWRDLGRLYSVHRGNGI